MTRDPEKYLYDMLESCRFLMEFAAEGSADRYRQDRPFRRVIERELQIVGEAMMQLKAIRPEMAAGITESDRIIGFRHVLVHGYFNLDANTVWDIVQDKLPVLQRDVKSLLGPTA